MDYLNENLSLVFQDSIRLVEILNQDILTIEHVFFNILRHPLGSDIINASGGDVNAMLSSLEQYLQSEDIPKRSSHSSGNPRQTPALVRAFDNMINHLLNSNQQVAGIGDFIVSIFREGRSYSARLMMSYGIKEEDVKRVVVGVKETPSPGEKDNSSGNSLLDKYARNLNDLAKAGKIDPLIGRRGEIERIVQILCRRKKSNPILLGEAGVGKSAIVEGFVLEVVNGNVPDRLKDSVVYSLDVSSIVAGTKYRGEFENRLQKVLSEIEKRRNVIIFLDEIHTVVGAGSSQGSSVDFSNILKPALANGSIKCIGATTFSEFKNSIEKDRALSRRFLKVVVNEVSHDDCVSILKKIAPIYEKFHNVLYHDLAIEACVSLSSKYMSERFLPDKAIDLLDEVGVVAHLSSRRKGNKPLKIKRSDVENLVSRTVNIPKSSMSTSESTLLKNLDSRLKSRIFSQDLAIDKVVERIRINKAGLGDLNRPIASFLFSGSSGVGKTELSRELAVALGIRFERIDMSEYVESHSVSKLIGSPAGYVGYENGGLLVNKIRNYPHCVLLLDEIEKAHPDIYNILLQIMDGAVLTDNTGNSADFKNVVLIMTTNAGSRDINSVGFLESGSKSGAHIKDVFSPEFRGRLDAVITFNKLGAKDYKRIIAKHIADLNSVLYDKSVTVKLDSSVANNIASRILDEGLGAREIRRIIDMEIKAALSAEILFGVLKNGGQAKVVFRDGKIALDCVKSKDPEVVGDANPVEQV